MGPPQVDQRKIRSLRFIGNLLDSHNRFATAKG